MECVYTALLVVALSFLVDGRPEVVETSITKMDANYGAEVKMYCISVGTLLPTIKWDRQNENVKIESINQTSTKVKSTLTIKNVCDGCVIKPNRPPAVRSYACQASNTNGTSQKIKFTVKVYGNPKAPVIYDSQVISSSSILIKWKAVKKVADNVTAYTVYYNADNEKGQRAVNITAKNAAKSNSDNYEYRLTKLKQMTAYFIFISAKNSFGEGTLSEPVVEKTLPIDPQPPEISVDGPVTSQNISLKFLPSPLNKRVIFAYQIFVEIINDKITSSPITLPKVYGNDSLKSKYIYVAAHFDGNYLPSKFVLGDMKWYGFHINKKLKALTKYRVYIRALAKSHDKNQEIVFGKPNFLEATTAFPDVPEIVVIESSEKWLKVTWNLIDYKNFYYKLTVKKGEEDFVSETVDKVPYKLQGLKEGEIYKAYLSICAKDSSKCKSTKSNEGVKLQTVASTAASSESSMQLLIIIIAVGSVVVLVIIAVAVVCFLRRRKKHKQEFLQKTKSDQAEPTQSKNGSTRQLNEDEVALLETKQNGSAANGMELKPIRAKPLNDYEESSTDPRTEWECPKGNIKIIKEIETDGFGKICKGSVKSQKDDGSGSVLLRILKDKPKESLKAEFLSIIEIMKKLPGHNGITNLLGCITKEDPITIILEYVPYGDLLGYMRTSRGVNDQYFKGEKSCGNDLGSAELMSFAEQIASAMAHLERCNVLHGDLAARNVLVGRQGLCKLTGIGEHSLVFDKDTYGTRKKDRLLIKWAAIETVMEKVRTIQSDVWSFGILLYEIATVGGSPYVGKDENWLLDMLKDDYRMPCPDHVSEALYSVMLDCWKNNPGERPSFEKLVKVMRTLTLMNKHQDHIDITKYDGELFLKLDDVKC